MRLALALLLLIDCTAHEQDEPVPVDTGVIEFDSVDDADIVWSAIPTRMSCGDHTLGAITVKNIGTTEWTASRGYRLGAVADEDAFADTRLMLQPDVIVTAGGEQRFDIEFHAPSEPGTYTTDWQMLREGMHWFGQTVVFTIEVDC